MQYSASVNSVHNLLVNSMMQKLHDLRCLVLLNKKKIGNEKGEKGINVLKIIEILLKLRVQRGKRFRNRKCLKNTVMSKISVSFKSKQN